jgi:penicillin-binding protein 2
MYEERSKIIRILIFAIGGLFILRLFFIQVLDRNYKQSAEQNALRKETIIPARGLIYDRKGRIIVNNQTFYDVMVTPGKVKELDTTGLCKLLDVDKNDFIASFSNAKMYSRYRPSPVIRQISLEQYGSLQERLFEFQGFFVQAREARTYPKAVAAHVLGYLGEVSDKEIEKSNGYFKMGDYTGKSGLEHSYEEALRGVKGVKNILVDVLNREQGRYMNGKFDVPSIAGKDLLTGIDLSLQEYGERLLKGRKGSIICIEPKTGEILAMVSMPSYDPGMLLGRQRGSNIGKLMIDPEKPMFNRAISARYPPGSTFKPLMALIGLQEHVLTPQTTYTCNGGYHLTASQTIHCHASGTFDLHGSIQMSCNTYYCNVFRLVVDDPKYRTPSNGLENLAMHLRSFGLGAPLGIDIPNENRGIIPTAKLYNRAYGVGAWHSSTIISLGIGQAEISFTPLQIANNASIIANKGYYMTPHFVRAMERGGKSEPQNWERHDVGIDTSYFGLIQDAMADVVAHGTATMAAVKGINVCGKTGTAQNPHGRDHSIFMAFAPKEDPKIALCVILENAGFGGTWAAPIGGLMIEKYLRDSVSNKWIEKWILESDIEAFEQKMDLQKGHKGDSHHNEAKGKKTLTPKKEEDDTKSGD